MSKDDDRTSLASSPSSGPTLATHDHRVYRSSATAKLDLRSRSRTPHGSEKTGSSSEPSRASASMPSDPPSNLLSPDTTEDVFTPTPSEVVSPPDAVGSRVGFLGKPDTPLVSQTNGELKVTEDVHAHAPELRTDVRDTDLEVNEMDARVSETALFSDVKQPDVGRDGSTLDSVRTNAVEQCDIKDQTQEGSFSSSSHSIVVSKLPADESSHCVGQLGPQNTHEDESINSSAGQQDAKTDSGSHHPKNELVSPSRHQERLDSSEAEFDNSAVLPEGKVASLVQIHLQRQKSENLEQKKHDGNLANEKRQQTGHVHRYRDVIRVRQQSIQHGHVGKDIHNTPSGDDDSEDSQTEEQGPHSSGQSALSEITVKASEMKQISTVSTAPDGRIDLQDMDSLSQTEEYNLVTEHAAFETKTGMTRTPSIIECASTMPVSINQTKEVLHQSQVPLSDSHLAADVKTNQQDSSGSGSLLIWTLPFALVGAAIVYRLIHSL